MQKSNSLSARNNAKSLRKNQTKAEQLLWGVLRGRKLENLKFRRQHPIGQYVVDFCCLEAKLIIELDGDSHADNADYDGLRTRTIEMEGFCVVRIANEDVMNDVDAVAMHIVEIAGQRSNNIDGV